MILPDRPEDERNQRDDADNDANSAGKDSISTKETEGVFYVAFFQATEPTTLRFIGCGKNLGEKIVNVWHPFVLNVQASHTFSKKEKEKIISAQIVTTSTVLIKSRVVHLS